MIATAPVYERLGLSEEVIRILEEAPSVVFPESKEQLVELALGGPDEPSFVVSYDVPGRGEVREAEVVACRNGLAVNYEEAYMRRRDPECMVVADGGSTDKTRFDERFESSFHLLRAEVLDWLASQHLLVMPFLAGHKDHGYPALLVAPRNAAFFAGALADLQGMIPANRLPEDFSPKAVVYLAPPFRHTHCDGRQVVIHNRSAAVHEILSLNLYPGPSAKKGIYGVLLNIGEDEGWVTIHGATVKVVTPYDNEVVITHEGASGGGKSEMLEYPHRQADGRLLLGKNLVTGERRHLALKQGCVLQPVTDDMALCPPAIQGETQKVVVTDAEEGWFVRVNHIDRYGIDPNIESLTVHPPEPLVFLNLQAVSGASCLIWEHTEDEPGKPCPNPRVILPRRVVPGVVNEPVDVDVRSFGVRTPPCSRENPSYGILGLLHLLPPALGWLWRLVAPRGHANPSITDTVGMTSEGVGSYWPFATGRRVDQANLLLSQILATPKTRFTLSPNQHIGAWNVGFMPQWIAREYLARRGGARFKPEQITPARCALLGYALYSMQVEGTQIPHLLLETQAQPEVGEEGYDEGAEILERFFAEQLKPYLQELDLDPLGREIITCCLDGGQVSDYERLIAM